jgi:hypothetical protein
MEALQNLSNDISQLLGDENTSDVVFLVGEEESVFYAHKLILWAR